MESFSRYTFSLLIISLFSLNLKSTPYANIEINLSEHSGDSLKLGYYFGKRNILVTQITPKTKEFKNLIPVEHAGIYWLSKSSGVVYEFMVSDTGTYLISETDNKFNIEANAISTAYHKHYTTTAQTQKVLSLQHNDSLSISLKHELQSKLKMLTTDLQLTYQNTFLGNYLKILLPVEIPEFRDNFATNNIDSLIWIKSLKYYQNHYLEHINWNDHRLRYTPILEKKITEYFLKILPEDKDLLVFAADSLLNKLQHEDMFRYVLEVVVNIFNQKKHIAIYEFAYVYMIKKYYLDGKIKLDEFTLNALQMEYNTLQPTVIGNFAPDFTLTDKDGHSYQLSDVRNDGYVLLLFWDFACPKCRQILDEFIATLESIDNKNLLVITIYTGSDREIWRAMVEKKLSKRWINLHAGMQSGIIEKYNIRILPTIYILNPNKNIIEKNVTVPYMERVLTKVKY